MTNVKSKLIAAILLIVIILMNGCVAEKKPSQIQIQVDASKVVGVLDNVLWANIGYGSLYGDTVDERLLPFWQQIRQTRAIRYVRCHNLYSDGIHRLGGSFQSGQSDVQTLLAAGDSATELAGTDFTSSVYYGCRVYTEDINGIPELDFWHLDHVFDVFLSAGVKPIVECDYMPDALAEGQPVRNISGGLINTPKDYAKWRELIYETVKHCVERYGVEEVRSWYWEIWNEPDLYNYFIDGVPSGVTPTTKQMERFLKMYDYFADGAKAADPEIRIGGPAIADHPEWLRLFLEHCTTGTNYATAEKGTPIDFISWHSYGSLDGIEEKNRIRHDIIELYPQLKDKQRLVDEWGWRGQTKPAIYTNYEAAFLCKLLGTVLDEPDWQPDLLLRWSRQSTTAFNTGYRPLSVWVSGHIIPLPIMNAYILLAKMGNERLELKGNSATRDIHGFASRADNGIQILICRFREGYEGDGQSVEVNLTVKGLSDSRYDLRHYRIDSRYSNATTIWEDMGQPNAFSASQLKQLKRFAQLQLIDTPSHIETKDGQTTLKISLPYNAVSLIVLGEEFIPMFNPGEHIAQVLSHENMYQTAQQKLVEGDIQGAKVTLKELIKDCVSDEVSDSGNPHCFWGQKALFALAKLEYKSGDNGAADLLWQQLLETTLNDTDRFILLQARLKYLQESGNTSELTTLQKELEIVRARLEAFADWAVWSDTPTK